MDGMGGRSIQIKYAVRAASYPLTLRSKSCLVNFPSYNAIRSFTDMYGDVRKSAMGPSVGTTIFIDM